MLPHHLQAGLHHEDGQPLHPRAVLRDLLRARPQAPQAGARLRHLLLRPVHLLHDDEEGPPAPDLVPGGRPDQDPPGDPLPHRLRTGPVHDLRARDPRREGAVHGHQEGPLHLHQDGAGAGGPDGP